MSSHFGKPTLLVAIIEFGLLWMIILKERERDSLTVRDNDGDKIERPDYIHNAKRMRCRRLALVEALCWALLSRVCDFWLHTKVSSRRQLT